MCGMGACVGRRACMAEEGMHGRRGVHDWEGGRACMAGKTTTAVDGRHPPCMHSCLCCTHHVLLKTDVYMVMMLTEMFSQHAIRLMITTLHGENNQRVK